jgi:hypothetical protein
MRQNARIGRSPAQAMSTIRLTATETVSLGRIVSRVARDDGL